MCPESGCRSCSLEVQRWIFVGFTIDGYVQVPPMEGKLLRFGSSRWPGKWKSREGMPQSNRLWVTFFPEKTIVPRSSSLTGRFREEGEWESCSSLYRGSHKLMEASSPEEGEDETTRRELKAERGGAQSAEEGVRNTPSSA